MIYTPCQKCGANKGTMFPFNNNNFHRNRVCVVSPYLFTHTIVVVYDKSQPCPIPRRVYILNEPHLKFTLYCKRFDLVEVFLSLLLTMTEDFLYSPFCFLLAGLPNLCSFLFNASLGNIFRQ